MRDEPASVAMWLVLFIWSSQCKERDYGLGDRRAGSRRANPGAGTGPPGNPAAQGLCRVHWTGFFGACRGQDGQAAGHRHLRGHPQRQILSVGGAICQGTPSSASQWWWTTRRAALRGGAGQGGPERKAILVDLEIYDEARGKQALYLAGLGAGVPQRWAGGTSVSPDSTIPRNVTNIAPQSSSRNRRCKLKLDSFEKSIEDSYLY